MNREVREILIFALDGLEDMGEVLSWVERLKNYVGMFKVGKESYARFGPLIVKEIRRKGAKVFLDLKFHDIPLTVASAASVAVEMGVSMLNVHTLGGKTMMRETVEAVRKTAQKYNLSVPIILGVTVLTSLDDNDIKELGFPCSAGELVIHLAKLAQDSGLSGVIASAHDTEVIKKTCGQEFVVVTPGIRDSEEHGDQKRVSTARDAILRGADYIVVGRPIRLASDPVQKALEITRSISEILAIKRNVI